MPMRIEHDPEFAADLHDQVRYLVEHGELERVVRLRDDLAEAEDLLASLPEAGTELRSEGRPAVRRLRLRRAPYVVWYEVRSRTTRVMLLRLFHVRQRTPQRS